MGCEDYNTQALFKPVYLPIELIKASHEIMYQRQLLENQTQQNNIKPRGLIKRLFSLILPNN